MAKNFNDISDDLIDDGDLLRLDLHISAPGYLEEGGSRFTEVATEDDDEENEDAEEPEVSDSEAEKKKQRTLRKEKRDARAAARLAAARPSATVPMSYT